MRLNPPRTAGEWLPKEVKPYSSEVSWNSEEAEVAAKEIRNIAVEQKDRCCSSMRMTVGCGGAGEVGK